MGSIRQLQYHFSLQSNSMVPQYFCKLFTGMHFFPHVMAINIKYNDYTLFILFYSCINFKSILKSCSARNGNELLRARRKGRFKEAIKQRY